MTNLSRPYQVALGAIVLLAAVWVVALRGHSSTSATGSSTPAPQPAAPAGQPAPSSPYHGSAPGVAGLSRAIEQARGAVAQSEASAKQLGEKSARASSPSAAGTAAGGAPAPSQPSSHSSPSPSAPSTSGSGPATRAGSAAPAHRLSTTHTARADGDLAADTRASHRAAAPRGAHSTSTPAAQRSVEAELKRGKVVAILFWNPHATVDQVVQRELRAVGLALRGKVAVMNAHAKQVGEFGPFTRAVQVYGTPTILIVNRHGQAMSLSGLTDAYSLEQAIADFRH